MPTRTRQSADTIDIAFNRMIAQTDPRTPPIPAKSAKRKTSFAGSVQRAISSFMNRSPPPDPSSNICGHCRGKGHWSNECPIWCSICIQQKGKEPRGHEAKDCRPTCANCNGSGSIRRKTGDKRTSETLELFASLASVKTVAQRFRDEHWGSRNDDPRHVKTWQEIRTNIEFLTMYVNMLQQDLERVFPSQAPGEIERGFAPFAPLDPFRDPKQKYNTR